MDNNIKIAILQRGWVFVGILTTDGEQCRLSDAYNIRTWGTRNGLGELVNGPLKSTILDKVGNVSFHELSVIAFIDCDKGWLATLKIQELKK